MFHPHVGFIHTKWVYLSLVTETANTRAHTQHTTLALVALSESQLCHAKRLSFLTNGNFLWCISWILNKMNGCQRKWSFTSYNFLSDRPYFRETTTVYLTCIVNCCKHTLLHGELLLWTCDFMICRENLLNVNVGMAIFLQCLIKIIFICLINVFFSQNDWIIT